MFSGIIDAVGEVASCSPNPGGTSLVVRAPGYWSHCSLGASIAVDGVCLTIASRTESDASFDVVTETLRRSTLGRLSAGSRVNLQKSVRAGDFIDGHFVQGHVDALATVVAVEESPSESKWWFEADEAARPCIIPKGSVTIDGISLTIADVKGSRFSVALIPTTLRRTTLGTKREGDAVNIETDILARTIVHRLAAMKAYNPT